MHCTGRAWLYCLGSKRVSRREDSWRKTNPLKHSNLLYELISLSFISLSFPASKCLKPDYLERRSFLALPSSGGSGFGGGEGFSSGGFGGGGTGGGEACAKSFCLHPVPINLNGEINESTTNLCRNFSIETL